MASVDQIQGLSGTLAIKPPCRVATTAAITLSGEQTIDGVAVVADDRVLVKDQATASENGIWIADTSAWSRALDFDGSNDVRDGTLVLVGSGTVGAELMFKLNATDPIVIGTTALTFTVSAVFTNISAFAATLLDDTTAAAARTTLGAAASDVVASAIGVSVQAYDADIPTVAASQGEMEAGTEAALRSMSPLRVKQAITALAPVATGTLTAGTPLVKNPYAASSTTTQAHGLSSAPILFKSELECLSADGNYSVGDKIQVGAGHTGDLAETPNYAGFFVLSDATNVTLIAGSTAPYMLNKTGYSSFQMTAAKWKLTVTPYALT